MRSGPRPVRGHRGGDGRYSDSEDCSDGRETVWGRRRRHRDRGSSSGEWSASSRQNSVDSARSGTRRRDSTRSRRTRRPSWGSRSDASRGSPASQSRPSSQSASELEPTTSVWLPGMPHGGPQRPDRPISPAPDFGVAIRYSHSQRAYFAQRYDTSAYEAVPDGDAAPPTSLWSEDEAGDGPDDESERSRVVGRKPPLPPFASPPQSLDGAAGSRMRRDAASPFGVPLSPLANCRGGHMAYGAGSIPTATTARWGEDEDAEVLWRSCGQSTAWRPRLRKPWVGDPAASPRGRGRRGSFPGSGSDAGSRPATPERRSRATEDEKWSDRGDRRRPRHRRRRGSQRSDSGSSSGGGGESKRAPSRPRQRRQRRDFVRYRSASNASPTGLTSASEAELDVTQTYAVDRHAAEGARHRRVRRATRQAYAGGRPPTRLYGSGSEDEGGSPSGRGGGRQWVPSQPRVLTSSRSRDARRVPRQYNEVYRV